MTDYEVNRTVSELQNLVQTNIKEDLIDKFNFSVITNNETVVIEEINSIYEIISTNNKNKNSKTSSIELGQCEYTLKEYYNIPEKEPLIIYKIDTKVEGKTGPSVLYQVFYPLIEPNKLEPLDLTVCEGEIIDISFPIDLENPELYDKESPYYHDICYSNSTKGKVDKIIDDRREEYSTNNKSLCEEGCTYAGYDLINKQVDCSCFVNFEFPLISEIKIDKNKLYKFMDIKKIANFNVLKCYRLVFSKVGLVINIGFYVFTFGVPVWTDAVGNTLCGTYSAFQGLRHGTYRRISVHDLRAFGRGVLSAGTASGYIFLLRFSGKIFRVRV